MIDRYLGEDGHKLLIEALQSQVLVDGIEEIAQQIVDVGDLKEFESGSVLIEQGHKDNHVFLIISGSVLIHVNGREVTVREQGQHVGEMALIDLTAKRGASVSALEKTVAVRISEPDFSKIADANPRMWRQISLELAARLRQRNDLIKPRNPVPVLFVGSSVDSLPIAREIQTAFEHDAMIVRLWTDGVFGASHFPIEDFESQIQEADFAILVLGPNDPVVCRGEKTNTPRDNMIFELGLFLGAYPRERILILKPRGSDLKIPTDLIGLTPLEFDADQTGTLASSLGPICSHIRKRVTKIGAR
jgi:CRP/FNR family transcriptional regulator, cyclic AMP receptor protein